MKIKLWEVDSGLQIDKIPIAAEQRPYAALFSSDARWLVWTAAAHL